MAIYFLDSSALVKRYITELGSKWVLDLFESELERDFFVAAIAGVEIVAAITRRSRSGSINEDDATTTCARFRSDLETDYQIIEVTEIVIQTGMNLAEDRGLRGYDAVQLAAAKVLNELSLANGLSPIIFVCSDSELNEAASLEGLLIENPNDYG